MADFPANIVLGIKGRGAEKASRAVKKIEESQKKIKALSDTLLDQDRRILSFKYELLDAEKDRAKEVRRLIKLGSLRRQELVLEKRELAGIVAEEKKRAAVLAKTQSRRSKLGKSAAAGAAFANIPGQNLLAAGAAGAIIGGAPGAAIAATVAAVAQLASGLAGLAAPAAEAAAELEKLRIALRGVVGEEYEAALLAIQSSSDDFNQAIVDTTRQFTQLSAAAIANGKDVKAVDNLYRGLAAAVKATGGNAEDLNGVLRAATQVISKNKVQAEELRGQIGDRLPGAFNLFAEATGRTSKQLDKALKDGEVSADEFVTTFADFIRNKYEPAAQRIADSPAEAGARLEKKLKEVQAGIGPILAAIGAEFQIFAEDALKEIEPLIIELNKFLQLDRKGKNNRLYSLEQAEIPEVEGIIQKLASRADRTTKEIRIPKAIAGIFDDPKAKYSTDELFNRAGKKLVELKGRAQQLRNELFPPARKPPTALTEGKEGEDEEKKKKRLKALQGLAPEVRDKLKAEISRKEIENIEAITEARVKGNKKLVEDLEILQQLIPLGVRRAFLEENLTDFQAKKNELLKTGYTLEQFTTVEKALQRGLNQTNLDIQKKEAQIIDSNLKKLQAAQGKTVSEFAGYFADAAQTDKELNAQLTETEILLNEIGGQVTDGLVEGLVLAVSGTENLGEAFQGLAADILEAIGRALILSAITEGLSALGGDDGVGLFSMLSQGIGKRAAGGPVTGGTPYIVGEKGPELFIPGVSGAISNNDQFDAARDAMSGGSSSGADGSISSDSAGVSSAFAENTSSITTTNSYMRERSMERSSQTTVGGGGSVVVETQVINNTEYASVEQLEKATQAAAKQARAQVFSDLRNRPATRASIGMR